MTHTVEWHGVGSEILSCCMYVPEYVFGIVSTVFSFFFLLPLCFLHTVANEGSLYIEGHSDLPGFRRGLGSKVFYAIGEHRSTIPNMITWKPVKNDVETFHIFYSCQVFAFLFIFPTFIKYNIISFWNVSTLLTMTAAVQRFHLFFSLSWTWPCQTSYWWRRFYFITYFTLPPFFSKILFVCFFYIAGVVTISLFFFTGVVFPLSRRSCQLDSSRAISYSRRGRRRWRHRRQRSRDFRRARVVARRQWSRVAWPVAPRRRRSGVARSTWLHCACPEMLSSRCELCKTPTRRGTCTLFADWQPGSTSININHF